MSIFELNAKLQQENASLRELVKDLQEEKERLHEELLDAAREIGSRSEPDLYR